MSHERIELNPNIMDGQPVVRGTRIPVELVLRKLGAGMSVAAILSDHPRRAPEDVLATQAVALTTWPTKTLSTAERALAR